jgi:hypothetical protein
MIQTTGGGARTAPDLARVGCAGRITSYSETGDGKYLIALSGVIRFEAAEELPRIGPYRQVRPEYAPYAADLAEDEDDEEFDRAPFMTLLRRYLDAKALGVEWEAVASAPGPALITSLCMALPFEPAEKQALLEAPDREARRATLETLLAIDAALEDSDDDRAPPIN